METEDDAEDPLGHMTHHMTGDLDLNDNNHIATENQTMEQTEITQGLKPNDESMKTLLPQQGGHQILYSPEDTINNDFFYDDEFAVQFDANLGGMEDVLGDEFDIEGLLQMTANDNQHWRSKMSASKSDSCLYQAELDFSDCSDPNRSSSERDLLTSSDMSDFKVEPLFSPPPGELECSSSGLGAAVCNEELAGSLVKDEDRYAFDWTVNKDRYMISFDRSPMKNSKDNRMKESLKKPWCGMSRDSSDVNMQESQRHMTCWGQNSGDSNSSRNSPASAYINAYHRSSSNSTGRNSSSSSSGPWTTANSGLSSETPGGEIRYSPPASPAVTNGNNSAVSTGTDTSSTMTTWKIVRYQRARSENVPEGMTTWRHICETHSTQRSQSMPDLQAELRQTSNVIVLRDKVLPETSEAPKRHSASLLEMYRKLKAQQGVLQPYCDPPPVQETTESYKQFEMETWSMSPASSHRLSPTETSTHSLTHGTLNHYNGQTDSQPKSQKCLQTEEEKILAPLLRNVASAPVLNDCAVQTSVEICAKAQTEAEKKESSKTVTDKSLQTSWELLTGGHIRIHRRQKYGYPSFLRTTPRPHSLGDIHLKKGDIDDERFTVRLSRQAKERMTRSLYFTGTALPDLSFLKKHMSCSIANLTETLHHLPANSNVPLVKPQTPITIPNQQASDNRPKKPPRQRRPLSACVMSGRSRDSSPVTFGQKHRSRSSDSASSFCSSSSSGIDPGSYESHRSSHCYLDQHRWAHHGAKVIVGRGVSHGDGLHNNRECFSRHDIRTAKVCNLCRAHNQHEADRFEARPMTVSHPSYRDTESNCRKSNSEEGFSSWPSSCDCTRLCRQTSVCNMTYMCHGFCRTECLECLTVCALATRCQHRLWLHRPLKSCLVKRRVSSEPRLRAMERRSWSDPTDGAAPIHTHESPARYKLIMRDRECSRRVPLTDIKIQEQSPETENQTILTEKTTEMNPTCFKEKAIEPQVNCCYKKDVNTPLATCCVDPVPTNIKPECCCDNEPVPPCDSRLSDTNIAAPPCGPVMTCPCTASNPGLCSSTDSAHSRGMGKKSVSFSEEVSYHSPGPSPHPSPLRLKHAENTGTGVIIRHHLGKHLSPKRRPVSLPPDFRLMGNLPIDQAIPEVDTPPNDFPVSPPPALHVSPPPVLHVEAAPLDHSSHILHMKDIIRHTVKATQNLVKHYSRTKDLVDRIDLVSSNENVEMGDIVLQCLCPAVYSIVEDGLNPHIRSLFGKVRNSPWRVVEESIDNAQSQVMMDMVHNLKSLSFLSTTTLKFNAFIFGLLNHKVLDVWLSQLRSDTRLLQRHYKAESFLQLSTTPAGKPLFIDLITIIQPLAGMPFRLPYDLEQVRLGGQKQMEISDKCSSSDDSQSWLLEQKQAARLKHIAGNASPQRGEISPVQGDEGQQQGVLHHSAPAGYHEQQVALYSSPAKVHWQSLYDKVKELKTSDIALQTKMLFSESMKSLKDSTTLKLSGTTLKISVDALQSIGQDLVMAAVGYSSPVKSLPHIPGLTDSTNSNHSNRHSTASSTSTLGESISRKVVPVTNKVLDGDDSDEQKSSSLLRRVSERLIGYNSPHRAYKQGVTEYRFDGEVKASTLSSSKSLDGISRVKTTGTRIPLRGTSLGLPPSLFDENGMPRSRSLEQPVEFQIPSRDSFDNSPSPATSPSPTGDESTQSKNRAKKLSKKIGSSLKRSWSNFGPKLVNFMDHLLLDENKLKKSPTESTAPPVKTTPVNNVVESNCVSSSGTSSGTLSPPSVITQTPNTRAPPAKPPKSFTNPPKSRLTPPKTYPTSHKPEPSKPPPKPQRPAVKVTNPAVSIVGHSGKPPMPAPRPSSIATRPPLKRMPNLPSGSSEGPHRAKPLPNKRLSKAKTESTNASHKKVAPSSGKQQQSWFVQALCHHVAREAKQLSYDKGTVFAVIKEIDSDWLLCRHGDKEGLVHRDCVSHA